jgi:hypothetical protein
MEDAGTVDLRGDKVLPYALRVIGQPADPSLRAAVASLAQWVADGAHRRPAAPGQPYAHADAVRIMDAWWPLLVQAVYQRVMGKPLLDQIEGAHQADSPPDVGVTDNPPHNNGDHLGSSWDTNFYGHVQKDLMQVLHLPVAQPDHRVYCGAGSLTACRQALEVSLAQAAAQTSDQVYAADGVCASGDQTCFDSIRFRPLGAITQPLIPWVNRPTFQQVVEVQAHRPFPPEPDCIYRNLPTISIVLVSGRRGRVGVTGRAVPRDCGVPPARVTGVSVSVYSAGRRHRLILRGTARGIGLWRVRLRSRQLKRGRYEIVASSSDVSGNIAVAQRTVAIR